MIRQKQSFEKLNTFQSLNLRLYISPTWKGQKSRTFLPHAGYQSYHMDIAECHNVLLNVSCPIRSETSQSLQCFSAGLWPPPKSPTRNDARERQSPLVRLASKASFRVFVLFLLLAQIYPNSQVRTKKNDWCLDYTIMFPRRGTLYEVNLPVR